MVGWLVTQGTGSWVFRTRKGANRYPKGWSMRDVLGIDPHKSLAEHLIAFTVSRIVLKMKRDDCLKWSKTHPSIPLEVKKLYEQSKTKPIRIEF